MGIDIDSKLMLVADQTKTHEVVEKHSEENFGGDFYSSAEDLGLDVASPWYDSGHNNWFIGVDMPAPTYEDLLDQESCWWDELNKAKDLLFKLTGEDSCKLDSFQNVW